MAATEPPFQISMAAKTKVIQTVAEIFGSETTAVLRDEAYYPTPKDAKRRRIIFLHINYNRLQQRLCRDKIFQLVEVLFRGEDMPRIKLKIINEDYHYFAMDDRGLFYFQGFLAYQVLGGAYCPTTKYEMVFNNRKDLYQDFYDAFNNITRKEQTLFYTLLSRLFVPKDPYGKSTFQTF